MIRTRSFLGYRFSVEQACEEALSLPAFPELLASEREFVLETIEGYFPD